MAPDSGIRELKDHGNGNASPVNFFSINADSDHGRPIAGFGQESGLAPWLGNV